MRLARKAKSSGAGENLEDAEICGVAQRCKIKCRTDFILCVELDGLDQSLEQNVVKLVKPSRQETTVSLLIDR